MLLSFERGIFSRLYVSEVDEVQKWNNYPVARPVSISYCRLLHMKLVVILGAIPFRASIPGLREPD